VFFGIDAVVQVVVGIGVIIRSVAVVMGFVEGGALFVEDSAGIITAISTVISAFSSFFS
jgi:hypothetical protein